MPAARKPTKFIAVLVALAVLIPFAPTHIAASADASSKLDPTLKARSRHLTGSSRVIVRAGAGVPLQTIALLIRTTGGTLGRQLSSVASHVAVVPCGFGTRTRLWSSS